MSDETDKLAAELNKTKPSKSSRQRGMEAAMVAFDAEFATAENEKISEAPQGLESEPRLTGYIVRARRVLTLGRHKMTAFYNAFTPRRAAMGGTCTAALIASFVVYQAIPFEEQHGSLNEPIPVVQLDAIPDEEPEVKAMDSTVVETPVVTSDDVRTPSTIVPEPPKVATKPVSDPEPTPPEEGKSAEETDKKDVGGIGSVSELLTKIRSGEGTNEAETSAREAEFRSKGSSSGGALFADKGGDEVIVTGRRSRRSSSEDISLPSLEAGSDSLDTGPTAERNPRADLRTERTIPAITKTVTRRVIKTPASTIERTIPAVTKTKTARVKKSDGTYETVIETVVIQEATTELITIPPTYETITELVVVDADGNVVSKVVKPQPTPQSGLLTAGDYDDVLNPDLYKTYLDKMLQGSLSGKDLPYVDANQRLNIRVVDRQGKALPLADISLSSQNGDKMFPLKTGADGMAYLYPRFDGLKPGTKMKVSVNNGRSIKKTITQAHIENGGDITVKLKTNAQTIEALDFLLTIDATGSMGDEMRYLQSELKAIVGRVEDAHPGIDIRTGLIVYRDQGDAYVVREIPFTDDIESFRKSLEAQSAGGGGDRPEAMHTAMQAGLKMNWRDGALKVNLLVADAPPHDKHISETWETGLISRTEGIHIVPLAASGVDKTAEFLMRSMAQITGGRFLFLTDDSGVGNAHAEPSVDCYVVTRLDGLVTRVLSSLIKGERVEPRPGEVIRSVGNYNSGTCNIEQSDDTLTPQNISIKRRR